MQSSDSSSQESLSDSDSDESFFVPDKSDCTFPCCRDPLSYTDKDCFYVSPSGMSLDIDTNIMTYMLSGFYDTIRKEIIIPLPVWTVCFKRVAMIPNQEKRRTINPRDTLDVIEKLRNNTRLRMKRERVEKWDRWHATRKEEGMQDHKKQKLLSETNL